MDKVSGILNSKELKPKERVAKLSSSVIEGKIAAADLIKFFEEASDVLKGYCADSFKHISETKPEILAPFTETLINYINYPLPRVRWGVPEAIGNISKKFPEKVDEAIPKLLENAKDPSTVVKWCVAYALTEIAKSNPKTRRQLVPIFEKTAASEKNNGVKNVYLKTLKAIEKEKP